MASFAMIGFSDSPFKESAEEAAGRAGLTKTSPEEADILVVFGWRRPKSIPAETKWVALIASGRNRSRNERLALWQGATAVMPRPADYAETCLAFSEIARLAA